MTFIISAIAGLVQAVSLMFSMAIDWVIETLQRISS